MTLNELTFIFNTILIGFLYALFLSASFLRGIYEHIT